VKILANASVLAGFLVVGAPCWAQQPETGPGAPVAKGHPIRSSETGTRGPSGGSPETGYHGPRDVTKDAEPGTRKSPEELKVTGTTPETPASKKK
jgi:hypothetical protein